MPSSQYPLLNAGGDFTAGTVQAFAPFHAWKASSTSRASTATLTADPDLTFTVAANAFYRLDGMLIYTGDAVGSGGIQFAFTAPAAANLGWSIVYYATAISGTGISISGVAGAGTARAGVTDGGVGLAAEVRAYLFTSSTAGTLALEWAQQTSDATATVLQIGSHLTLMRMA